MYFLLSRSGMRQHSTPRSESCYQVARGLRGETREGDFAEVGVKCDSILLQEARAAIEQLEVQRSARMGLFKKSS